MDPAFVHIVVTFLALRAMVYLTDSMENWSLMLKKCHQEQHFVFEEKQIFLFVVVFFFLHLFQGLSTESDPSQSSERLSAVFSHFILLSAVSACLKTPQPFCHPTVPDH